MGGGSLFHFFTQRGGLFERVVKYRDYGICKQYAVPVSLVVHEISRHFWGTFVYTGPNYNPNNN